LDNLGAICARLPTGAGGSPFALRFRVASRRATRPCAAHGRTSARLSEASTLIQPLYNHFLTPTRTRPTATQPQPYPQPFPQPSSNRFPTPHQPSGTSTPPQPSFSRQTDDPALGKHPRLNHPSCRIQERFRLNHPTSAILQLRQRRAAWTWLVHQLPRPSRHFLHHPRREGDRQAAGNASMSAADGEKRKSLEKWAFRGVCPSSFQPQPHNGGASNVPRIFFFVRFSTTIKCWARQIRRDGERANRVLGMATR